MVNRNRIAITYLGGGALMCVLVFAFLVSPVQANHQRGCAHDVSFNCGRETFCGEACRTNAYMEALPRAESDQTFSCASCTVVCNIGFFDCTAAAGCETADQRGGACTTAAGTPGTWSNACGTTCAETARPSVTLAPFVVQADDQDNPGIWINKTGTGRLLQLQGGGTDRVIFTNGGQIILGLSSVNDPATPANDPWTLFTQTIGATENLIYGGVTSASTGNVLLFQRQGTPNATLLRLEADGDLVVGSGQLTVRRPTAGVALAVRNIADDANTFAITDAGVVTVGSIPWDRVTGSVPWARLTAFPEACGAGTFVTAAGGTLTCAAPTGVATAAGTVGTIARFTGTGVSTTLGDSIISQSATNRITVTGDATATRLCIAGDCRASWAAAVGGVYSAGDYVTIGADNRISATHTGTCFGPIFVGTTGTFITTGDILGPAPNREPGYAGANARCAAAPGLDGSHACTGSELLNSINCRVTLPTTGTAWISNGLPGFTSPAVNDCAGWTSNAGYGAFWDFGASAGFATSCDQRLEVACCR